MMARDNCSHTCGLTAGLCRSDDGSLKYDKLHEWARELGGNDEKHLWLDKVCACKSLTPHASTHSHRSCPTRTGVH